jgi:hypothetical protein
METKAIERAIETKAIAPLSHGAVAHGGIRSFRGEETSAGVTETAATDTAAAPREILAHAALPTLAGTEGSDQGTKNLGTAGQEFVVLTAWEEVQTSSPNSRTVADYETDASDREQTDNAGSQSDLRLPNKNQSDTNQGAQITVTRMILVFYPASAATGAQPAPTTGSPSHRPTASYGGWLFFQL